MSFTINIKLCFLDSFQFLSSSLDSLVESLGKDDFKYLRTKDFDINVLDLVKQKEFYPYEYISDFENLGKSYLAKKSFIIPWLTKKSSDKDFEHVPNVWRKL